MMDTQPTREALMQRIAALEAELQAHRGRLETTCADDAFGKARQDLKRDIARQRASMTRTERVLKDSRSLHHSIFEIAAEQRIRESEEKFSRAFQLSPDPAIITRLADGQIVNVNASFLNTFGYSLDEVVGRTSVEGIHLSERVMSTSC